MSSTTRLRLTVLTGMLALDCAGRMHLEYQEKLTSEYVYPASLERTVASVESVLRQQGFEVERRKNNLLLTGWQRRDGMESRLVALAVPVDETHSQIRIYQWQRRPFPAPPPRTDVEDTRAGRLEASIPNIAITKDSAVRTGEDPPDFEQLKRDGEMEWTILQKLDAKAAKEIEAEKAVVSGGARVPSAAPRPQYPMLPARFCSDEISGADELVQAHRLILFGEFHGTNEAPGFVGRLACQAAAAGQSVVVALELPRTDQPLIDQFLDGEGTQEDIKRLLEAGRAWKHTYYDGRSSKAVLETLDRMRVLRRAGLSVHALFYDEADVIGAARDLAMAQNLEAARRAAIDRVFLVLTGNVHARTTPGTPWDLNFVPMGFYLQRFGLRPIALNISFSSGAAWNCEGDDSRLACGVHEIRDARRGIPVSPAATRFDSRWRAGGVTSAGALPPAIGYVKPAIKLWNSPSREGYMGEFLIDQLTPSPPAYPP